MGGPTWRSGFVGSSFDTPGDALVSGGADNYLQGANIDRYFDLQVKVEDWLQGDEWQLRKTIWQ